MVDTEHTVQPTPVFLKLIKIFSECYKFEARFNNSAVQLECYL